MPPGIADDRLLGGLDLAATLQAGRPLAARGLLAETDGGVIVLAMAERLGEATAAHVAAALDRREVVVERQGIARNPARIGVVALDEGIGDEGLPARLKERLAFWVALDEALDSTSSPWSSPSPSPSPWSSPERVRTAAERCGRVQLDAAVVESLCAASLAFGIDSARATLLASRAAMAAAALDGRERTSPADAALAAALVLAPRATRLPVTSQGSGDEAAESPVDGDGPLKQTNATNATDAADAANAAEAANATDAASATDAPNPAGKEHTDTTADPAPRADSTDPADPDAARPMTSASTDERVLEATRASIPHDLLATLAAGRKPITRAAAAGRAGALQAERSRGRPAGTWRGDPSVARGST